jgi:hypothetical protein
MHSVRASKKDVQLNTPIRPWDAAVHTSIAKPTNTSIANNTSNPTQILIHLLKVKRASTVQSMPSTQVQRSRNPAT